MNNIFNLNTLYWRYKTYLKLNFLDKQGLAVNQHPPETSPKSLAYISNLMSDQK